jgi:hypothetical protein
MRHPSNAHFGFSQVMQFLTNKRKEQQTRIVLKVSRGQDMPFTNLIEASLTVQLSRCLSLLPQTVEEHMQLSFSHIMKHWKRNPNQPGVTKIPGSSRNVLLRFYPPQSALGKSHPVYKPDIICLRLLMLQIVSSLPP